MALAAPTVRRPLSTAHPEPDVRPVPPVRGQRPRTLLICPDPDRACEHKDALERCCAVTSVASTDEAVRALVADPGYKLVLCPGVTPSGTAVGFLRQLRALRLSFGPSVLVFDIGDDPTEVINAIQQGARQCISGSCAPRELAAKVDRLLHPASAREES
jgi:DNA-binding NarL/FixJ family response regulator